MEDENNWKEYWHYEMISQSNVYLSYAYLPYVTGHIAWGSFPSGEQVGFQPGHHSTAPASTQGIEIK